MYRDKDRQREAVREAVRRHRQKKGITVIPECNTRDVIPCNTQDVITLAPGQDEYINKSGEKEIGSIMPDDYGEPEPQSYNPFKVGYVPPRS